MRVVFISLVFVITGLAALIFVINIKNSGLSKSNAVKPTKVGANVTSPNNSTQSVGADQGSIDNLSNDTKSEIELTKINVKDQKPDNNTDKNLNTNQNNNKNGQLTKKMIKQIDSTEFSIDINQVKHLLSSVSQFDIINILRTKISDKDDNMSNIIISDYFIVLSNNESIHSDRYQTIIIAPAISEDSYNLSTQKDDFIKVELENGDSLYVIVSSMRSIPKISVIGLYSSISKKNQILLQKSYLKTLL